MIINVSTDNEKIANAIEQTIRKNIDTKENGKYIFFRSKEDFLECLYYLAIYMQNSGASLDVIKTDVEYTISTGHYTRKRRITRTHTIDEAGFTYP